MKLDPFNVLGPIKNKEKKTKNGKEKQEEAIFNTLVENNPYKAYKQDILTTIEQYRKEQTTMHHVTHIFQKDGPSPWIWLQRRLLTSKDGLLQMKILPFVEVIISLLDRHRSDLIDLCIEDMLRNIDNMAACYQRNVKFLEDKIYFYHQAGDENHPVKVLHLHGLVGSRDNFLGQITDSEVYENSFHIVPNLFMNIYDLNFPGFNKKDKDMSPFTYMNHYLHPFIVNIAKDGIHIDGVSIGGEIAYKYAAEYPNIVKSVILSGAAGLQTEKIEKGKNPRTMSLEEKTEVVHKQFYAIDNVPPSLPQEVHDTINNDDKWVWMIAFGRTSKNVNIPHNIQILNTLRDNQIPVELIRGKYDQVTPIGVIALFTESLGLKEDQFHLLSSGHTPNIEVPEEYNQYMISRLKNIEEKKLIKQKEEIPSSSDTTQHTP